jgi:hypothetical protein
MRKSRETFAPTFALSLCLEGLLTRDRARPKSFYVRLRTGFAGQRMKRIAAPNSIFVTAPCGTEPLFPSQKWGWLIFVCICFEFMPKMQYREAKRNKTAPSNISF